MRGKCHDAPELRKTGLIVFLGLMLDGASFVQTEAEAGAVKTTSKPWRSNLRNSHI
jgi:hypothetical protein